MLDAKARNAQNFGDNGTLPLPPAHISLEFKPSSSQMSEPLAPRKRRIGCLAGLMLFFLLGFIAFMAIDLAFEPWIYVVGGRVRLFPVWAGSGVAHAPSGPYTIYLWFSPAPSGSRILRTYARMSARLDSSTGMAHQCARFMLSAGSVAIVAQPAVPPSELSHCLPACASPRYR